MLIKCKECEAQICNKSEKCIKCGAPIEMDNTKASVVGGIFIIVVVYLFFFPLGSSDPDTPEIVITNKSLNIPLIGDTHTLEFTAKNVGPNKKFNYYIRIGDHWYNRVFSDKFCEGSFVLEIEEEKSIKTSCVISVPSKRYNLFINNELY